VLQYCLFWVEGNTVGAALSSASAAAAAAAAAEFCLSGCIKQIKGKRE
jgi:hypothetical protein